VSGWDLVEEAAADPSLTVDGAAIALLRASLLTMCKGEKLQMNLGQALEGLAALKGAGGSGSNEAIKDFLAVIREGA